MVKTLLVDTISPPRIPLFNTLAKFENLDFSVLSFAAKEVHRKWKWDEKDLAFKYDILPGIHAYVQSWELPIHLNWKVFKKLRSLDPDVIITHGYSTLVSWEALLFSKYNNKKHILWNGTTLNSTNKMDGIVRTAKEYYINNSDSFIAYGTKAQEYLIHFGVKRENISIAYNTVDVKEYCNRVKNIRNSDKYSKERKKWPRVLLLYVGQLIKRKGVLNLLRALKTINNKRIGLIIVGDGPRKERLQQFAQQNDLDNVFFMGFKQPKKLPEFYALADVFVFPTFKDVWGLVINEALASGLYTICSDRAGAYYDLINGTDYGESIDPRQPKEIAKSIENVTRQIEDIRQHQTNISAGICRDYNIEKSAEGFIEAIRKVT